MNASRTIVFDMPQVKLTVQSGAQSGVCKAVNDHWMRVGVNNTTTEVDVELFSAVEGHGAFDIEVLDPANAVLRNVEGSVRIDGASLAENQSIAIAIGAPLSINEIMVLIEAQHVSTCDGKGSRDAKTLRLLPLVLAFVLGATAVNHRDGSASVSPSAALVLPANDVKELNAQTASARVSNAIQGIQYLGFTEIVVQSDAALNLVRVAGFAARESNISDIRLVAARYGIGVESSVVIIEKERDDLLRALREYDSAIGIDYAGGGRFTVHTNRNASEQVKFALIQKFSQKTSAFSYTMMIRDSFRLAERELGVDIEATESPMREQTAITAKQSSKREIRVARPQRSAEGFVSTLVAPGHRMYE